MTAFIGSLSIVVFLVGFVCVIYPIRAIGIPTRKMAGIIMAMAFVVLVIAVISDGPATDNTETDALQSSERIVVSDQENPPQVSVKENEVDEVAEAVIDRNSLTEKSSAWNVHTYQIVENEDISSIDRFRRMVKVVAPTAVTREDRIATLMDAAKGIWQAHSVEYITLFLLPFPTGPAVAKIDFAPDKCGISGEDCTGKIWTSATASKLVFTPEERRLYLAWENNKERFKEMNVEFGFEVVNDQKLRVFLSEQFESTPDDISTTLIRLQVEAIYQDSVEIPPELAHLENLNEEEQARANAIACRSDLQCWGDRLTLRDIETCADQIEKLARYDHEWTDGIFGTKFSRFRWKDRRDGTLTYVGDEIKFQNAYGAWIPHTYFCDYDPGKRTVLGVHATPGRL